MYIYFNSEYENVFLNPASEQPTFIFEIYEYFLLISQKGERVPLVNTKSLFFLTKRSNKYHNIFVSGF